MRDYFSWLRLRGVERSGDLRAAFAQATRLDPRSRLFGNIIKLMRLKLALATRADFDRADRFELVPGSRHQAYFEKYREYLRCTKRNDPRADELARSLTQMQVPSYLRNSLRVVQF